MAELASLWAGERLSPIEVASARSFSRHGDRLTVYSPMAIANLPPGVTGRDAAELFPSDQLIRHRRTGSPALHADLFRYSLMARTYAIWVDLDLIALRPFEFGSAWVFGRESSQYVNNAVLRLPRDSVTLHALLALDPDTVGFPPHLRGVECFKFWLRTVGRGAPIDRWVWGATGPKALTHFLGMTGEVVHALHVSAFYAIPYEEVGRLLTPGALTEADLPAEVWAVHLWASALRPLIRDRWGGRIPADSFLGRAMAGNEG